uniref:Uncharacterized protein n=1 Tax=Oryza punctata TaxID=4537 RepID=A0A0E0LXF7_ORYPU
MEATALSVGKSVVNGALGYAKSAFAEEVALQLGIQRDHAFIRDELHMMQAFLMAAHDERDEHKVVKAWVQQVRDVAYDVEDCLQDMAVRVGRPSWWRKCNPRTLLERRSVAKKMKELRAKIEDVSHRSNRYRLIDGSGSKAGTDAVQHTINGVTIMSETEETRQQQERAKKDLVRLINTSDKDLRVIAIWGKSGVLDDKSILRKAYDDLKIKKFECYAWIELKSLSNHTWLLQSISRQLYENSLQETRKFKIEATDLVDQILQKMGKMEEDDLVSTFMGYLNEKSYLIVITDLTSLEEWNKIRTCFPSNDKGSRIIVCTEHIEVARLCVPQDYVPPEHKKLSDDHILYAFYEKGSQDGTHSLEPSSSSNITTAAKSFSRTETMIATLEESQLIIGRAKEKSDIIKLITNQDSQQSQMISVWGMGGLGKTTLVQDIYRNQEVRETFVMRACLTVLRPFNCAQLIKSLAKQFGDENATDLTKLLEGKRYLVVLDDLWNTKEWDDITRYLPNNAGSCIIVTTREESIAKHCSNERNSTYTYQLGRLENDQAHDLFTKKVFKEADWEEKYPELVGLTEPILKKCGGLPLAIVTIGGFLANQPKSALAWRKLNEHVNAELEMNPKLETIKTVLLKSYDGLPYHLKSCFLYLSIFPEDYKVSQKRLMQRWIAEDYTMEMRGKSKKEIAHDIFMELISRSMILLAQKSIEVERGIDYCQLHDLMREISITKSMEENLVFRLEEGWSSNNQGTTRHLAISSNWKGDKHEFESMVDLCRVRSLTVFGKWKSFFISEKMRMLRVLDLEDTEGLVDHHLEHIGKLAHLRYLSLRGCDNIWQLPSSLGDLSQLETLDIRDTRIAMLPKTIVKLRKLKYLHAGRYVRAMAMAQHSLGQRSLWLLANGPWLCGACCVPRFLEDIDMYGPTNTDGFNRRDACNYSCCIQPRVLMMDLDDDFPLLPRGSRKLKGLHTLRHRLTQLRKLGVAGINKKNGPTFCSAISKLSQLESLSVRAAGWDAGLHGCLDYGTSSSTSSPPENLQSLKLEGKLGELPQWIGKLQNLVKLKLWWTKLEDADGAIKVLGALPSLAILGLWDNSFSVRVVCLNFRRREATAVLFPSLRVLQLYRIGDGLESVQFGGGATPKLELLQFGGNVGFLSGLEELPSLRELIMLDGRGYYNDDFVKDVEEQLANHPNPNKPLLKWYC